jgi:hypothetical protein
VAQLLDCSVDRESSSARNDARGARRQGELERRARNRVTAWREVEYCHLKSLIIQV